MDDPVTQAEATLAVCAADWCINATIQVSHHERNQQAVCQQNIKKLHILAKENIHMLRYAKGKSGTIYTRHKKH
jgi:hypothetical protein